jgi:hypothetical protein
MRVLPHFKQLQLLSKDEQNFIVLKKAWPYILSHAIGFDYQYIINIT